MKRTVGFALVGMIFVGLVMAIGLYISGRSSSAQAVDTAEQRCTRTQGYLKSNLEPHDLRARVNRVQAYQYVHQRLERFVSRLERNKQPGVEVLKPKLDQLDQGLQAFKTHYEEYNTARDQVVKLSNCKDHIDEFQARLETARTKRQKVHSDVKTMQQLLDEIKVHLEALYQNLLATEKSGSSS